MADDTTDNGNGRMLARIDERVSHICKALEEMQTRSDHLHHDHECRIRLVEKQTTWTQIIGGIVAIALGGWGALGK